MARSSPALVMVGGPNGSGKTTLIRALRATREIALPDFYINADDLRRERRLDARAAQKLAATLRLETIAQRRSLMYETVMSHPSKIAELQAAALAGYTITVIFIATQNPEVNIERVMLRVADGGHDVPKDRIRERHRRSIALAPSALALAAHAYLYDNTAWGTDGAQQLQAALIGTLLQPMADRPAPWVTEVIEKVNGRARELEDLYRSVGAPGTISVPNLLGSSTEGPIAVSGKYYALQMDQQSGKALVHDKALLSKSVLCRQSYRIEYLQGVATVTRRSSECIRAVRRSSK